MGFCTALRLLRQGVHVTMVASKFGGIPSKTAPAVFRPDWAGSTDPARLLRWGLETKEHLRWLHRERGSGSGITSVTHHEVYRFPSEGDPGPVLPRLMDGWRPMTPFEDAGHRRVLLLSDLSGRTGGVRCCRQRDRRRWGTGVRADPRAVGVGCGAVRQICNRRVRRRAAYLHLPSTGPRSTRQHVPARGRNARRVRPDHRSDCRTVQCVCS